VPFFFGADTAHLVASLALSGLALFGVGALISLFTGKSALFSGSRQLLIGAVAAAITFGVGKLIGVSTGI
jgi:VIT1/CCC1 family predicted Fe2+/Mn2+ transporter